MLVCWTYRYVATRLERHDLAHLAAANLEHLTVNWAVDGSLYPRPLSSPYLEPIPRPYSRRVCDAIHLHVSCRPSHWLSPGRLPCSWRYSSLFGPEHHRHHWTLGPQLVSHDVFVSLALSSTEPSSYTFAKAIYLAAFAAWPCVWAIPIHAVTIGSMT